jgi:hypothetical protein
MKCPRCGYESREVAGFGGVYGQSLIAGRTCLQCRHANPQGSRFCDKHGHALVEPTPEPCLPLPQTTSFTNGRYQVKKFLGEGGKKKAYPTHNMVLDRDAAFYLIKTVRLVLLDMVRVSGIWKTGSLGGLMLTYLRKELLKPKKLARLLERKVTYLTLPLPLFLNAL